MVPLDPTTALRAAQSPATSTGDRKPNAAVFGAVGKVGEALLNSVLASARYERVFVLTRWPLNSTVSRLAPLLVNGHDLPAGDFTFAPQADVKDVFLCLADTRTFYRRDDVYHRVLPQHVLPLAQHALSFGATRMVLLKPADALMQMGGYGRYLSDSEELALVKLTYRAVVILRPHRDDAQVTATNPVQRLAHWMLATLGSYMTPARLRPRRAKTIADAALAALETRGNGVHIISLDELHAEETWQ